jgi:curved DNA-binding protein CbpA
LLQVNALSPIGDPQDYYKILGVAQNASESEIREAFYARAKTFHPDRRTANPHLDADYDFGLLTQAYDTLRDNGRRKAYNEERARRRQLVSWHKKRSAPPRIFAAGITAGFIIAAVSIAGKLYFDRRALGDAAKPERAEQVEPQLQPPVSKPEVKSDGAPAPGIQTRAAPCNETVTAWNDNGLERIRITSSCRSGETVRAAFGGRVQTSVISAAGDASFAIAIAEDSIPVILAYQDGRTTEVAVEQLAQSPVFLRITMLWDAPVGLRLHVVEPGGQLGAKGDAAAGHAPERFGLIGKIDLEDDGSGAGPFQQSYYLSNREEKQSGIFSIYVENVTRGRFPSGEYCGSGQYAQVAMDLIVSDRGKIRKNRFELPAFPCLQKLDDREYYTRIRF